MRRDRHCKRRENRGESKPFHAGSASITTPRVATNGWRPRLTPRSIVFTSLRGESASRTLLRITGVSIHLPHRAADQHLRYSTSAHRALPRVKWPASAHEVRPRLSAGVIRWCSYRLESIERIAALVAAIARPMPTCKPWTTADVRRRCDARRRPQPTARHTVASHGCCSRGSPSGR